MTLGGWFTRAASHLTGGLPLVPRGSKLTRSKRAATAGGTGLAFTRLRTPELPGPPGMRTRVPILLMNSLHDPATSYEWATDVAGQLGPNAVLLTYDGWGHGVRSRTACTRDAYLTYLTDLVLPAPGTHCPTKTKQKTAPHIHP